MIPLWANCTGINAALSFWAPLTTTIVPARASSPTPTFTRATAATVQDWEGRVYSVLSGEVRFQGARRVRNYVATRSEFASVTTGWTAGTLTATAGQSDPVSGTSAAQLVTVGAGDNSFTNQISGPNATGAVWTFSFWAKASSGTPSLPVLVDDAAGFFALNPATNSATLSTSWQRFSFTGTQAATASTFVRCGFGGFSSWTTAVTVFVYGAQLELVTGQSNQNPAEYVSVGVLAAPYQGSNADGIQCFSTQNGNTVASHVVTAGTGAAISTSVLLGYLSEQQSTNLVLQSENFGTTWAAVGTPTRVAANTRCGGVVLDLIGDDDAGVLEGYTQTITFTGNAVKAVSIFFAQGTSTSSVVRLRDTTAPADRLLAAITWAVGVPTVTMTTGTLLGVDTLGNSCFRARVLTSAVTAANVNSLQVYPATDAALSVANTGNINFGGVQAQDSALYADKYVPTTTATVTKNFDNETYPVSGNLPTNDATIYFEWTPENAAQGTVYLWGSLVDANNSTAILHDGTNIIFRKRIGGVNTDATKLLAYVAGTTYKIAARASSGSGQDIYVNGVIGTNQATTTAMQLGANFQIGADGNSASPDFAEKRNLKIWARSLTDAQIAAL